MCSLFFAAFVKKSRKARQSYVITIEICSLIKRNYKTATKQRFKNQLSKQNLPSTNRRSWHTVRQTDDISLKKNKSNSKKNKIKNSLFEFKMYYYYHHHQCCANGQKNYKATKTTFNFSTKTKTKCIYGITVLQYELMYLIIFYKHSSDK
ncbi:hypothetical protein T11_10482 [Trichinella zimbabwensis]|uniref:Uncharacterized protein n=1 Tax=Trichinella zimbabwensis TaxID=268475 RepID=A0A0V1HUF1_9BILA|nr:hypothetical protein T11_10482 [Trichinella zimbabwensis]